MKNKIIKKMADNPIGTRKRKSKRSKSIIMWTIKIVKKKLFQEAKVNITL